MCLEGAKMNYWAEHNILPSKAGIEGIQLLIFIQFINIISIT